MKKKNNLIILLIIFVLPFAFSYYFLKTQKTDDRWETTNYGKFIEPLVPLEKFRIELFNRKVLTDENLKNKWTLIYLTSEKCLDSCTENIHLLKQINIALRKDMSRVQRIFLSNYDEDKNFLKNLELKYPSLLVSNVKFNELYKKLHKISKKSNQIYLISPNGNAILSYDSNFDGKKLLKDLKKLLKFSKKK